jgi:type IV pilus assembly protein PilB
MERKSLIDKFLLRLGLIKEDEVSACIKASNENGESLFSTIIKVKKLDSENLAVLISKQFGLPYIDLNSVDLTLFEDESLHSLMDTFKAIPVKKTLTTMTLIVSDPTEKALQDIKFQANVNNVHFIIADNTKLQKALKFLLEGAALPDNDDLLDEEVINTDGVNKEESAEIEDAPIVKFVHGVLLDAIKFKASDIHFEPYEKTYRIRYRIDGELVFHKSVSPTLKDKIASRIKVISNMDISEKRIPQDGRMKLGTGKDKDKSIDFRVSSLPTVFGEKIVMRMLDSSAVSLDIDKLGYDPEQKAALLEAVARPYGMVLVTGPTGSGKTVSLYSCLNVINKEDVNICTAEDPAEIQLPGVNQVNMNDKAGLNFANTLKSFLRQDPDVILVGEIRDFETADIAIKAAQTGHMVLSTLHTNDAPKTIARLLNMGVKPFNIASSVNLITAQRLSRRLCSCKKIDDTIPLEILIESGLPQEEIDGYGSKWHVYKPVGCPDCGEKGYKGRVGIYQVMPINEEIKKIILREGTEIEIAEASRASGVYSLREAGMVKVKMGITSLEEVLATTNID